MKRYPLILAVLLSPLSMIQAVEVNKAMLALFQPLPEVAENPENPITEEKVDLGRMLYYETRLSKNRQLSCNSCHDLASFGDDGLATSKGIHDQLGGRSAPSVFNAAVHISQFWDGRADDVEAQAVGPITNPIEMGMPDPEYVLKVLNSIPGYVEAFSTAFPEDDDPVSYENVGKAIGAFERKLLTPSRFDDYLKGNEEALSEEEKAGLNTFLTKGCGTCHNGAGIGGHMYQKLGLVKEWETNDLGRYEATKVDTDKFFFKVPSLRNIAETGPYLHDGSIETLEEIVAKMGEYQLGQQMTDNDVASIVTFLKSLTGDVDEEYVAKPKMFPDGPETPKGDS